MNPPVIHTAASVDHWQPKHESDPPNAEVGKEQKRRSYFTVALIIEHTGVKGGHHSGRVEQLLFCERRQERGVDFV